MTGIQEKILKLLSNYPEREFYSQEVVKRVKCSKASASGFLKLLNEKGVISKKTKGHMKFYQINLRNSEVKKFKINWALNELNSILPKLRPVSQKIILFGSASRGEQTFDSDFDILILAHYKEKVLAALKKISGRLPIKALVKTPAEWSELEVKEPEFYQEIKKGITLYERIPRI